MVSFLWRSPVRISDFQCIINSMNRGFTIVELLVSLAIFGIMTTLVMAKYGKFNHNVLLTNLAWDTALVLRTAQTYGMSVTSASASANEFQYSYGVYFTEGSNTFVLFADKLPLGSPNKLYDDAAELLSTYNIKKGARVSEVCVTTTSETCETTGIDRISVLFKRPDPNAIICYASAGGPATCGSQYAEITLMAADQSTRKVFVRSNGQISVE